MMVLHLQVYYMKLLHLSVAYVLEWFCYTRVCFWNGVATIVDVLR